MSLYAQAVTTLTSVSMKVCPVAPPGADHAANQIQANIEWFTIRAFIFGGLIGLAAIIAGRMMGMPHFAKGGLITIIVAFICGLAYFVVPGMIGGTTGSGCI